MIKNYRDIIKETKVCRKEEYINFFFKNIVGTDIQPIYSKENPDEDSVFEISIIKNTQEKKSKRGNKYTERYWRNCIFYFLNKKDAYLYLNAVNKDNYSFSDASDNISWDSFNGFENKTIDSKLAEILNNKVFKYFKKAKSSWFVRSYVYFVLIFCDEETQISTKDYYINYWNNNYAFKKAPKSSLFGKTQITSFVKDVPLELSLIKDTNKDSIDCVMAYLGMLDFFHDNEEAYTDIKADIENNVEFILCQGAARTGKTILAMRLLHDFSDFKLLLMNYNFYKALKEAFSVVGVAFPHKRIFHHDLGHLDGCWISGRLNKTFKLDLSNLIVDEAQRLGCVEEKQTFFGTFPSVDEIRKIIECPNHSYTIFFGDDAQKLNPKYDQGFETIKECLADKNYREYYFSSPLGVPPEIIKNIRFLLGYSGTEPYSLNQFNLSIEKDPSAFIEKYLTDNLKKKHLVVPLIGNEQISELTIGSTTFKNISKSDMSNYLFNEETQNKYFLTAYSVISREIESVYLFIPKHINLDEDNTIQTSFYNDNSFLLNHLYTIMTRSTISLTICCEDQKLAELFNEKINAIGNVDPQEEQENDDDEFDYDIFISYFGTNYVHGTYNEAKRLCDILKQNGLKVFLLNYSMCEKDLDIQFSETWHVISRSQTLMFVFNEYVRKDSRGLIERKDENGGISRIYQELEQFEELICQGDRKAKYDAKFYYEGNTLDKYKIYPFLNKYIPPLTQGNSNCCFMSDEEMIEWAKNRFNIS